MQKNLFSHPFSRIMLQINIAPNDNLEKALKQLKKKFKRTKTLEELRERKQFIKPSVKRRKQIIKAKYVEQLKSQNN
ncbi:MAG: 30S ribosomal protein S21 [Bacteroidetes bacterium MED-G17]|jgi:small subunit ribosomal protein S21|nr:MAG: 30S ribosomal protein S21 [Bacteroidetes bacterium MED-G17]|tara:strand:+ start:3274 stop:3504 length:231 start_codon:yes stop_codon:yes gene_type:complete